MKCKTIFWSRWNTVKVHITNFSFSFNATPVLFAEISVWIAEGVGEVELPTVFSTPSTHCQNMYCIGQLYTYDSHHNFGWALTVEKFNLPANFLQLEHLSVAHSPLGSKAKAWSSLIIAGDQLANPDLI